MSCLAAPVALAIPDHYSTAQLYHSQWTVREGAPAGMQFLAQTPEGFLWIAAPGGLYRFDGVQFELVSRFGTEELLSRDVFTLISTPEGGLWIGYRTGGASYLLNGQLTNYSTATGLPESTAMTFASTPDGATWAGTTRGLYRLEKGRWRLAAADWNIPERGIFGLAVDRQHVLWMVSESKIFYLRPGTSRFERLPVEFVKPLETAVLSMHPDGTPVLCTREDFGVLKLRAPADTKPYVPDWNRQQGMVSAFGTCQFDRDGRLWVSGDKGAGRFPGESEAQSTADHMKMYTSDLVPLTSNVVYGTLEDREGNIWFATRSGLDQFRAPAFSRMAMDDDAFSFGLSTAGNGGMWIATNGGNVYRAIRGKIEERTSYKAASPLDLTLIASSRSGDLWIGEADSIWRRTPDDRYVISTRPPAPTGRDYDNIMALVADVRGETWVSVAKVGVYRVADEKWTLTQSRTDKSGVTALVLFADAQSRVWAGYSDGAVFVHEDGRAPVRVGADVTLNAVLAFAQQGKSIWIGSDLGLWRTDGAKIQAVSGAGKPLLGVAGIVPTINGDLWLNTAEGVVHIAAAELDRVRQHPEYAVRYKLMTYLDGLPGNTSGVRPLPKAAMESDGRIWFAGADGVFWVEPAQMPHNDVVPSVIVKSMVADGVRYAIDPKSSQRLPMRTRQLNISYTAPSLTMPERVTFKYRLEGHDVDWQDVGTRREAYFTDLPPGNYRFRVIASNNDGVWNETGAAIDFDIPPTFVQSRWFTALWIAVVAIVLWLLYLFRLRSVQARLRLRLEERMVERERIARELHDTFLQGVQGLMLRFQSAMERIPPNQPSRELMEDALDRADQLIADGREAVTNLRVQAGSAADLAQDLRVLGESLSKETGIAFSISTEGLMRELDPMVRAETQRLVGEALTNAFWHSQATEIKLTVSITNKALVAHVADNGRGFDPRKMYDGHWGLVGMRERASRMHAKLNIESGASGTQITLEVPTRIAFNRAAKK